VLLCTAAFCPSHNDNLCPFVCRTDCDLRYFVRIAYLDYGRVTTLHVPS
jgi:hypothetical protein